MTISTTLFSYYRHSAQGSQTRQRSGNNRIRIVVPSIDLTKLNQRCRMDLLVSQVQI
jgi:hypothetical protein